MLKLKIQTILLQHKALLSVSLKIDSCKQSEYDIVMRLQVEIKLPLYYSALRKDKEERTLKLSWKPKRKPRNKSKKTLLLYQSVLKIVPLCHYYYCVYIFFVCEFIFQLQNPLLFFLYIIYFIILSSYKYQYYYHYSCLFFFLTTTPVCIHNKSLLSIPAFVLSEKRSTAWKREKK